MEAWFFGGGMELNFRQLIDSDDPKIISDILAIIAFKLFENKKTITLTDKFCRDILNLITEQHSYLALFTQISMSLGSISSIRGTHE